MCAPCAVCHRAESRAESLALSPAQRARRPAPTVHRRRRAANALAYARVLRRCSATDALVASANRRTAASVRVAARASVSRCQQCACGHSVHMHARWRRSTDDVWREHTCQCPHDVADRSLIVHSPWADDGALPRLDARARALRALGRKCAHCAGVVMSLLATRVLVPIGPAAFGALVRRRRSAADAWSMSSHPRGAQQLIGPSHTEDAMPQLLGASACARAACAAAGVLVALADRAVRVVTTPGRGSAQTDAHARYEQSRAHEAWSSHTDDAAMRLLRATKMKSDS